MREMTPPNWGHLTSCMEGISRYLTVGYRTSALYTGSGPGIGRLDAHVRRRVRAIIVRQKKRPRFLYDT